MQLWSDVHIQLCMLEPESEAEGESGAKNLAETSQKLSQRFSVNWMEAFIQIFSDFKVPYLSNNEAVMMLWAAEHLLALDLHI